MSDFHAIGGVSATLQTLLLDRMELPESLAAPPPVTIGPPPFSAKDNDPHKESPRLNLFLYRVTENGYLQNQEPPGRGSASGYGHPPLSLNLHYLITAYGNKEIQENGASHYDETDAQFLLGSAMRVLHDVPIVTESITSVRAPSGVTVLDKNLRESYEQIRLSLEPLTLEDVTKVWTALALRYRLSAAYVVNVVQIESRRTRTFPRAVGQPTSGIVPPLPTDPPSPGPWIYALTIQTPTITDVRVRRLGETVEQPFPYARIEDTLVLHGTSLSGPETSVVIDDVVVPASLASPLRVEATIPNTSVPGYGAIPVERQLQPGVRTVKVVTRDPNVPHASFSSSDAAFMLVPFVDKNAVTYGATPTRRLTIAGERLIPPGPGGETLIGRSTVTRSAYIDASPTQLIVPIPPTLPTQSVQVQIGTGPLPDPLTVANAPAKLRINIDGTIVTATRSFQTTTLPLADIPGIVAGMIHDAAPLLPPIPPAQPSRDPRFLGAHVELWDGHLLIIPGDLTSTIAVDTPGGGGFAAALGLTAAGSSNAYVSGELTSPPPLSSTLPRVQLRVGAAGPVVVDVARTTSLDALAEDLQAGINAFPGAAFTNAQVATTGAQLLFIPGTAGTVVFEAVPGGDDRTVVELQLRAQFSVRVRVNGAESIDPAVVVLPQ